MIIDPYFKGYVKDKINIIAAPTGCGKTYSIMNIIIPRCIELGYQYFIGLNPYTDNVFQDKRDYTNALFGKAHVTTDIDEFLDYDYDKTKRPIVFLTTLQGASMGGSKDDEDQSNYNLLIKKIQENKGKVCVNWDEAHFGCSSTQITQDMNILGYPKSRKKGSSDDYSALYYFLMEESLTAGARVTGFTATPVFEQRELLEQWSRNYYVLVTKDNDWPTLEERTEIGSQYRELHLYDIENGGYRFALKNFVSKFNHMSELLKNNVELAEALGAPFKLASKFVLLVSCARTGKNGSSASGVEIGETIDTIKESFVGKVDPSDYIIGSATQEGYYIYNLLGDRRFVKSKEKFFDMINDDSNPLKVIIFIEKFKFGINIPHAKFLIAVRERRSKEGDIEPYVTNPIIQTMGRVVRPWFGILNNEHHWVSSADDYAATFKGTPFYALLIKHMELANGHVIWLPDNGVHNQAMEEWKKDYAAPVEMSQFNKNTKSSSGVLPFENSDVCPTCGRPFDTKHINSCKKIDDASISEALGIEKRIH